MKTYKMTGYFKSIAKSTLFRKHQKNKSIPNTIKCRLCMQSFKLWKKLYSTCSWLLCNSHNSGLKANSIWSVGTWHFVEGKDERSNQNNTCVPMLYPSRNALGSTPFSLLWLTGHLVKALFLLLSDEEGRLFGKANFRNNPFYVARGGCWPFTHCGKTQKVLAFLRTAF